MTTHLTLNGDLRSETDADVVANLQRKGWVVTVKPGDDYEWQDGAWAQRPATPAPTYTAEGWLDAQGYGGARTTTLLYLLLQLQQAGKSSAKLNAVKSWTDSVIAIGALDPDAQRDDWTPAPYSFAEVTAEAVSTLAQQ